jgi:hypothetical protein
MKLLQEGDIIELMPGHTVYASLPMHFIYENEFGNFSETARTEVTIGEPKLGLDTSFIAGRYVVTSTSIRGGGTGMGPHDVYPDGHHVDCQLLMQQGFDLPRRAMSKKYPLRVAFYQTGCFTAMIPDIASIGRAKAEWHEA